MPDAQLYRDVFNASPIGIAVENLEGQPRFVNPALCSMLGFREDELRRNIASIFLLRKMRSRTGIFFSSYERVRLMTTELTIVIFAETGLWWGEV
jgi:PAS domain S-box-containing protein